MSATVAWPPPSAWSKTTCRGAPTTSLGFLFASGVQRCGVRRGSAPVRSWSENFDIPASLIDAAPVPAPSAGQRLPVLSRPHVVEMRPDKGLPSVAITGNNLSGCLEGINRAGVCVVALADGQGGTLATDAPQVGLDESLLPRFVLDTCHTAAQAREALHEAKHYTRFSSCHFLIADAHGDAFVWEREGDNVQRVVDAGAAPLIVTNHLLSREDDGESHHRRRSLVRQLSHPELTSADVHAALDTVRAEGTGVDPAAVTLWRTEYDPRAASMAVRFLLDVREGRRYSDPVSIGLR
jgi:Acyl-coenzyme A:6-aminopenicillanic acid acyl-transferase